MNESIIKIKNENGILEDYKVLFTFRCEELDKDYIIFTKEEMDSNNNIIIYVAYYNPNNEIQELIPVIDEDELRMAYETFEQVKKSEEYTL